MNSRTCNKCHVDKPIQEFYSRPNRDDQFVTWCKSCLLEHNREYLSSERGIERTKRYNRSPKRKESLLRYTQSPDYPKKKQARSDARLSVISGKIAVGECEYKHLDNCHGRLEMHHDDYDKPLEIRWMCARHHRCFDKGSLP